MSILAYAKSRTQYAVSPQDELKGLFDPNQDLANQQAKELAMLNASKETELRTIEEYEKRKQALLDRYSNERWQKEADAYAQGLGQIGGAFDVLAGMVERSAGKQSSAYKAMFAISKGFAIAEASVKLSQAVMQAMSDPSALTPAQKFANMAAITSAGIVHRGEYVLIKKRRHALGEGI
ncbi:hypothetical protein [Nicoletella semolina]|uniref:hypothetical protein n=1 Tax=Nicoletella semolina TaxID=271160 RepID=UPI001A9D8E0E|nr:hypothetical protein [Nicoletella semolina]